MNVHQRPNIGLQRLPGTPDEARVVQQIYDAAPSYAVLITGAASRPGAAQRTFELLPDGCRAADKRMYLITAGDEGVGFTDVIHRYPDRETAYIGLFMIAESFQGRGIGQIACARLEAEIASWSGIRRIQLAAIASNSPALKFWRERGFRPTGERTRYESGPIRSEHVFFEKQLDVDP